MTVPGAGEALETLFTLREWDGMRVLAGPTGPDAVPVASGVTVIAVAAVPDQALVGQILVILEDVDRADWRLDVLLRRARAAGAVALLLAGTAPVSRATAALAERLRLTVLGTATPLEAGLAARRLLTQPAQVRADQVLRVAAACRRAGPTVDDLARELGHLLRRPVALLDRSGHVTAGSLPGTVDDLAALGQEIGGATALTQDARVPLPSGAVVLAAPVVPPGGEPTAWTAAMLPAASSAEEDAVAPALAVAAIGFGHRLAVRRLALERDARGRTSLFGELLNAGGAPSAAVRRRAVAAGWTLDGWHTAVRITVRREGPTAGQREVDTVGLRGEVVAALAAQHIRAVVVEQGDGWSAWTTAPHEPGAADVQAHSAALRRAQRELGTAIETYVGVGRPHHGPGGLTRTLAEAADACRLAASRPQAGHFVQVDRLGLAQLLLAWTRTDTFQPAARTLLRPLEDQPGDLLHTLGVYLDAESSTAETAAVLGVHRNTVAGRIGRIQQLLAVDLTDAEQRLALHLACRTVRLAADGEVPRDQ